MPEVDPSYDQVPVDEAVRRLTAWAGDEDAPRLAELVGGVRSGRTGVLERVRDTVPGALWLDATGRTAEDLVRELLAECGVDEGERERRADWAEALDDAGLGERLVIVAQGHRTGATRRSTQPARLVRDVLSDLTAATGGQVLVEAAPGEHGLDDRLGLRLPDVEPAPEAIRAGRDEPALVPLALAELRLVPTAVWSELACGYGSLSGSVAPDADSLRELARRSPHLTMDDEGEVSFVDESLAEVLRAGADPEAARAAHAGLVRWLTAWAGQERHPPGWAASGPVGRYATRGLAMHAVLAGGLGAVGGDGGLAAHLDQVALIDAASVEFGDAVPHDSLAGDAVNLWMSGVDGLAQPDWAAWLHLMCVARGDQATARAVAGSGLDLPWRPRWAHWRPPGGMHAACLEPGPVLTLREATGPEGPVVLGQGMADRRWRLWDADTGRLLDGPWRDRPDGEPVTEDRWPRGADPGVAQPWVNSTDLDSVEPPFVAGMVQTGEDVVVCGMGGVLSVSVPDADGLESFASARGEAMTGPFGETDASLPSVSPVTREALEEVFGPRAVRRVPEADLPADLTDPAARRVLAEIGVPAVTTLGFDLRAVDEGPEVSEASGGSGPHVVLGAFGATPLLLDCGDGAVRLGSTEGGEPPAAEEALVAATLDDFLAMLHTLVLGLALLTMASSRAEREELRRQISTGLEWIGEDAADAYVWQANLADF